MGGDPRAFRAADTNGDGRLDSSEIGRAQSWDERIKAAETAGDAWITAKVSAALLLDQDVSVAGVSVVTHDGTVRLAGTVRSAAEAQAAMRVAAQVEGVVAVVNALTVKRSVAVTNP
jgi:osmotically-inducible protein OsmY